MYKLLLKMVELIWEVIEDNDLQANAEKWWGFKNEILDRIKEQENNVT